MFYKKSDQRGDLFLVVHVKFPEDGWLKDDSKIGMLQDILPKAISPILADTVDEVAYDETADIEEFGAHDDGQPGGAWVDEDEDEEGQPQCAQQ